jgi:hypothetical protein
MWIIIHARGPFRAEEGTVGGVNLVFEGIHQVFYVILIVLNAVIDPEIRMRCDVA